MHRPPTRPRRTPVTPAQETEELAARAAAGDSAALDLLLVGIRPEVLRRCGRFLVQREDAEEAAQDVLFQVARKIGTFEGRSQFHTWLYTVVANCCRQKYRELKRRRGEQPLSAADTDTPDPRRTSMIAGTRVDLLEALERLESASPELVAPLVYRDICQMEYREIEEQLGIPMGTVKSRLHNARRQVRNWLADPG
ncbi:MULTISPECIES: RNA polymerase sigma factor [unclassified Streptomyces]|uniref:RNA polymerase sigma factor n=1 Tax=unclassified Streptomyces TaxID=2593676 RepID=UPI003807397E